MNRPTGNPQKSVIVTHSDAPTHLPVHVHAGTGEQGNAKWRHYASLTPTPYHLATQRAAALYVPGHPTEAWRAACREAEREWDAMKKSAKGAKG